MKEERYRLYAERVQEYLGLFADITPKNEEEEKLIFLTALQRVLDSKLKRLIEDPRPLSELRVELQATRDEFDEINKEIHVLLTMKKDRGFIKLEHDIIDALTILSKLYEQNTDYKYKEAISFEIVRLHHQLDKMAKISIEYSSEKSALYDLLIAKAQAARANNDYLLSRVGKGNGFLYAASQVFIMVALGILFVSVFGPVGLVLALPMMIIGAPVTGLYNWWLFRSLIAKTLIILRDLLFTPTDVPLTKAQKFKLAGAFFVCLLSGFTASFSFYALVMFLVPAFLKLLGISALVGAFAAASPWLVPVLLGICAVIFVGTFISVAVYFLYSFYHPSLSGNVRKSINEFFDALYLDEEKAIEAKINELYQAAFDRYKYYYEGEALQKKCFDEVTESTTGIVLIKNLARVRNGEAHLIKKQARFTDFLVRVLVPLMIGGIVSAHLLAFADLSELISEKIKKLAGVADYLSWGICGGGASAYIPVICGAGARCVIDIRFDIKKAPDDVVTSSGYRRFKIVVGINSFMNGLESLWGYIMKKAEELSKFAHEAGKVFTNPLDAILGIIFALTGAGSSFFSSGLPMQPTHYDKTLDEARENLKRAAASVQALDEEPVKSKPNTVLHSWRGRFVKNQLSRSVDLSQTYKI